MKEVGFVVVVVLVRFGCEVVVIDWNRCIRNKRERGERREIRYY